MGRCATELPVPHQHRHRHPPRCRWITRQLQRLVLPLTLTFVPPVLKPDFDLVGGEFERVCQVFPLRGGQVALLSEAPLQLGHLGLGEEDPGLPAQLLSAFGFVVTVRRAVRTAHLCTSEGKKVEQKKLNFTNL